MLGLRFRVKAVKASGLITLLPSVVHWWVYVLGLRVQGLGFRMWSVVFLGFTGRLWGVYHRDTIAGGGR